MHTAHTTFANSRNPWTGQAMTKSNKPRAAATLIDIGELSFSNDPIPAHRKVIGSKYAERKGLHCGIKTMSDYGDGFGRVWLLAKDAPKLKRAA